MKTFAQILKWGVILAALALVAYVLYQVIKAVKAGANAAQAARDAIAKAWVSSKSALTPGWSSLVPKPNDMPVEMANRYAQIQAGRLDVGPNPNVPWWEKRVFEWPSWLGGTKGTPQTLGSSQQSVNVDPINVKNLTPTNQRGEVTAPLMGGQGTADGSANLATGSGNSLPPASVNVGPSSPLTSDITDVTSLNYTAPGATSVVTGASGGLNNIPPSGEPDYSQNEFLGQ